MLRVEPPVRIATRHLHESGVGDECGRRATLLERHQCVIDAMDHEGWNAYGRQNTSQVHLHADLENLPGHRWARTCTLISCPPRLEAFVTDLTRGEQRH